MALAAIGLTPISPVIKVDPVVEIPVLERITKLPAVPRLTAPGPGVAGRVRADSVRQGPFEFSPGSYNFTYILGGNPPTEQSGTFTNITSTPLMVYFSMPNKPGWLDNGYTPNAYPMDPGVPSGLGQSVNPTGLGIGTYSSALYISGNFTGSPVIVPVSLTVKTAGSELPDNQTHPEDTNVLGPDGTVYRISTGSRSPYTSAGAFLSYGYNTWAGVQVANSADMALPIGTYTPTPSSGTMPTYIPPRDGSLINDHGTVYIVYDHYRQGFTSAEVFLGLGYSFANVLPGDASFLTLLTAINSADMAHPSGTVVNDRGTICVIESPFRASGQPGRRCFSTLSDMNSWGIKTGEIIKANSYDHNLAINGVIPARTVFSLMNP